MDGKKVLPIARSYKGGFMAKIIEFYVPIKFRKKATKWIAPQRQAKVIPFNSLKRKSA
jgi:hypothetical protein